jgi:histone deacetylase 1/2
VEQGKEKEFQCFEGEVMWLYRTRPDLHYVIGLFARFVRSAGPAQIQWTKQLLRYLALDPARGIIIDPGEVLYLHGGSDADWGGDEISQRSTSGNYLCLGKVGVVSCSSRLQRKVADSSTHSETYAAHEVVKNVIEVEGKLREMGVNVPLPIRLLQDNQAVVKMSKNPIAHAGSRHYRIPQAYIREKVDEGLIVFQVVSSEDNPADMFTKPSAQAKFTHDRDLVMGIGYEGEL